MSVSFASSRSPPAAYIRPGGARLWDWRSIARRRGAASRRPPRLCNRYRSISTGGSRYRGLSLIRSAGPLVIAVFGRLVLIFVRLRSLIIAISSDRRDDYGDDDDDGGGGGCRSPPRHYHSGNYRSIPTLSSCYLRPDLLGRLFRQGSPEDSLSLYLPIPGWMRSI